MAWAENLPQQGYSVATGQPVTICVNEGKGCITRAVKLRILGADERVAEAENVDYFAAPNEKAEVYDAQLAALADALNALLREANAKRPDPHMKLGLFASEQGLVPIWKYEDAATAPQIVEGSLKPLSDDILWPK